MENVNLTEIRIGRNVNGVPMSDTDWARFTDAAHGALRAVSVGVVHPESWIEVHEGGGKWDGDETSAVVTLYWAPRGEGWAGEDDVRGYLLEGLSRHAEHLAFVFRQDAVAVVSGGRSFLLTGDHIKVTLEPRIDVPAGDDDEDVETEEQFEARMVREAEDDDATALLGSLVRAQLGAVK